MLDGKAAQNFDVAKLLYLVTCRFCEHTGIVAGEMPRHLTCSHCGRTGLIPAAKSPANAAGLARKRTVKEGTGRGPLSKRRSRDSVDERAEACRKRAMKCERLAMASSDAPVHLMYLDLAKQWREMAEQVDYFNRAAQKGPAREIKGLERS
jgi:hypothetical protein